MSPEAALIEQLPEGAVIALEVAGMSPKEFKALKKILTPRKQHLVPSEAAVVCSMSEDHFNRYVRPLCRVVQLGTNTYVRDQELDRVLALLEARALSTA